MPYQTLLQELGRRLRAAREAAGLSVTSLAERAGVSRRYVTEAEAGRANLSLIKLAELARALRVPLKELCDLPTERTRTERIALVGLRGAGKSSVGRALALALEVPFVELDQRIAEIAGLSLGEIFELHGAEGFHRFEAEALERVLAEGERVVIAAGGSIVDAPESYARLLAACRCVWLRASGAEHLRRVRAQGDARPMRGRPRAAEELEELLERRSGDYARCELALDTSGECVEDLARAIRERLRLR